MGWIAQEYEGEVHVVPDTDARPHVLAPDCWCHPEPDPDVLMFSHRDELERSGPPDPDN